MYHSWDMLSDRQTNEKKKWHVEVGDRVWKQHSFNHIPLFTSNVSCISSAALIQGQNFYKVISQLYIILNNTLCFATVLTASFKVNFIISFGQYLQFYSFMIWKIYVLHKWIYINSGKLLKGTLMQIWKSPYMF